MEPGTNSRPDEIVQLRKAGLLPAPGVKLCTGCHTTNASTSLFCYKCGLKLPGMLTGAEVIEFYGGFWRRLAAFFIDSLLISVPGFLVLIIFAFSPGMLTDESGSNSTAAILIATLSAVVISPIYWTFSIGKWGKSIGKLALGLKVLRVDGFRLSYNRAFARFCAYCLCFLTLGLGFLVIGFNRKKRGLHDYVCGTVVIKT